MTLSLSGVEYVSIDFSKDKFTIQGAIIECHCSAISSHQVRTESIVTLIKILKILGDQPIVIGANNNSFIYLMEAIL